jgi:hypothetical protein
MHVYVKLLILKKNLAAINDVSGLIGIRLEFTILKLLAIA